MNKAVSIATTVLLIASLSIFAEAKKPVSIKIQEGNAKVTFLKGHAEAVCEKRKGVIPLAENEVLEGGCQVTTGKKSLIELRLPDNSIIRFSEKTKFKLVRMNVSAAGERNVKVSMTIGKVWSNVKKKVPGKPNNFEIACQNAVAGVRATIYRMDVENDQSAVVKVYEGEVRVAGMPKEQKISQPVHPIGAPKPVSGPSVVEGPKPVSMEEWVYIVKSMQKIQISAEGTAREPEIFSEAEDWDDWVKWNKVRDRKEHR